MTFEALIARAEADGPPIPVVAVQEGGLHSLLAQEGDLLAGLAETAEFKGKAGQTLLVPGPDGRLRRIVFGLGAKTQPNVFRSLPARLPAGDYAFEGATGDDVAAAYAFALGAYRFDRYRKEKDKPRVRLVVGDETVRGEARRLARAAALVRDLVNTPAADMGPQELEDSARAVAEAARADLKVVLGDALRPGYPAVHAVGRAAAPGREPRLIEMSWRGPTAAPDAPLIALIGKGVCFDTGGLDVKPSAGMRWMKKDMGGAAHALGLARLLTEEPLNARLLMLLPTVENAISADAMRPGDVLSSRSGLTIEVGNTDAEGRLILADALARAGEASPALTITLATLTGAARVALGPEVVPFYTDDEGLAEALRAASEALGDPLWRMPLWDGYEGALDSDIADVKNDPDAWAQAGSVTAALFLRRFAPKIGAFLHLDLFAWNSRSRPGAPQGAEVQGMRALHRVLKDRFG